MSDLISVAEAQEQTLPHNGQIVPRFKDDDILMTDKDIPHEYYGWWQIIETLQG